MKPNWKDAPEWAKYLAMGEDGDWFWYSHHPSKGHHMWLTEGVGRARYAQCNTRYGSKWEETVEFRPSQIERNLPTERRIAAVELVLSLGYKWNGTEWTK